MGEDAREVAERAMPGWVVVDRPRPTTPARGANSVAVDIEALKRKWFGQEKPPEFPDTGSEEDTELVVMRMKGKDAHVLGNRTVIVRDGKIIGMQG